MMPVAVVYVERTEGLFNREMQGCLCAVRDRAATDAHSQVRDSPRRCAARTQPPWA